MESKQKNQTQRLGTEPVVPFIFRLAVPTIIAQVINLLYTIVDRIYIGRIAGTGHLQLTGIGVCLPLIMLATAFSMLAGSGGAPRASIALGQKNERLAGLILGNCFSLLLIMGAVLTLIFFFFASPMLMAFGASITTLGYALSYMRIYALGTVFVMITLGMNSFITAQGYAKMSMYTVLIGAVLNIILDPIFIFVFGMQASGAALATVLSQAVSAVWVVYFLSAKAQLRIKKENMGLRWSVLAPCLALGLSPFIMVSTESLLSITFNASLLKYGGDLAVGAMTILASVMQFSTMPVQGLTQGALPVVSYNFGAGNRNRVRTAFFIILFSSCLYSLMIWAIVMLCPSFFSSLFTHSEELLSYASWAIRIYMAMSGIFGIQLACQQTFIGIGDAKSSLFLALLRKVVLLIPLIFILPHFFANKVFAVFLAEPVADFLAVSVTGCLFFVQFRKALAKMV